MVAHMITLAHTHILTHAHTHMYIDMQMHAKTIEMPTKDLCKMHRLQNRLTPTSVDLELNTHSTADKHLPLFSDAHKA